jgi:hypothetical protein
VYRKPKRIVLLLIYILMNRLVTRYLCRTDMEMGGRAASVPDLSEAGLQRLFSGRGGHASMSDVWAPTYQGDLLDIDSPEGLKQPDTSLLDADSDSDSHLMVTSRAEENRTSHSHCPSISKKLLVTLFIHNVAQLECPPLPTNL